MLLSGRAELILDDGPPFELRPFDVVRQRETNHSWVNLGPGPAVFISLMHGVTRS
jgi:quercetin dioxygenase-like cupin family protein